MNFFQNIGFVFGKNNSDYIKKEISKTYDKNYIKELIEKSNPDAINYDVLQLAVRHGYEINENTPVPKVLDEKESSYIESIHPDIVKFIIEKDPNVSLEFLFVAVRKKKYEINENTPYPQKGDIKVLLDKYDKYCLGSDRHHDVYEFIEQIVPALQFIVDNFDNSKITYDILKSAVRLGYKVSEKTPVPKFSTSDELKTFVQNYKRLTYEEIEAVTGGKSVLLDNERLYCGNVVSDIIDKNQDIATYEIIDLAYEKGCYTTKVVPRIDTKEQAINIINNVKNKLTIQRLIDNISSDIMDSELLQKAIDKGYVMSSETPVYIRSNEELIKASKEDLRVQMLASIFDEYSSSISPIISWSQPEVLDEDLLRLAAEMGYKTSEYSPEFIRNNEDYMRIISSYKEEFDKEGLFESGLSALPEEKQKKLILKAIDNGYLIGHPRRREPLTEEEQTLIDKRIYQRIKEGKISKLPSYFHQFKYIKYAMEEGYLWSINDFRDINLTEKEKEEVKDLVYKAIDKGYHFSSDSPTFMREFKYIKYAIEKGEKSAIYYLEDNNLTDEQKKEVDNLVYMAIDNTYTSPGYPSVFYNFKYIKYAIETKNTRLLSKLIHKGFENKILTEEEKKEIDDLVYTSIDEGIGINSNSPTFMKQFKYIKYAIEKGQTDALDLIEYDKLTEEEKKEIDDSIYKSIDNGKINFLNAYVKQFKYIKYAIEKGHTSVLDLIEYDKLTKEDKMQLDELIYVIIEKGYIITPVSPEYIFQEKYIKHALLKQQISLTDPSIFQFDIYNMVNFNKDEFKLMFENVMSNINNDKINLCLMLLVKYNKFEEKEEMLNKYYNYLFERVKGLLKNKFKDDMVIDLYINQIMSDNRNPLYFSYIQNTKDLSYVANYTDLKSIQASENNVGITNAVLNKGNKKQIKKIIELLRTVPVTEDNIPLLAINIYISVGFVRAQDLLLGKYGAVYEHSLLDMFKNIIPSNVLFEQDGKGFKPQLNEQWINLIFGQNYKISNTPIRNYLNEYSDKKNEINKLRREITDDMSLTQGEKEEKLKHVDEQFEKYRNNLVEFFKIMTNTFNDWDIIEEEILKSKTKSTLDSKLNLSKVVELFKTITTKRKMPNLEPRDEVLLQSDVFDYAFYDTQYVSNVHAVPLRIVELSRRMDNVTTKKFPNVTVTDSKYTMKVYGPQDRRLLSAGYRSHCCFRACGNADNSGQDNSLLNYCVSTEYGGGVEIFDENGNTIMFSPILRDGNVLMIHSVETNLRSNLPKECYELLVKFSEGIINESQQKGDDISFVTITNLHYLNISFTKGELPSDKKFHIYDEENKFNGMYTNLGCNHMILAQKEGKKVDDIIYGSVPVNYEFDVPKLFGNLSISKQEKNYISEMDKIKDLYIDKSNQREKALKIGNEEQAYQLLTEIKELKKEYLNQYKHLVKIRNSTDIYSDYKKACGFISSINEKTGKCIDLENVFEIAYSTDWYIVITSDNEIITNALESGKMDLMNYLNKIKETRNINNITSAVGDVEEENVSSIKK